MNTVAICLFLALSLALSILTSSCSSLPLVSSFHSPESSVRQCPQLSSKIILPRYYPPKTLYLGLSPNSRNSKLIYKIYDEVNKGQLLETINIVFPQGTTEIAAKLKREILSLKGTTKLNFIPYAGYETMWMQDYFEQVVDPQTGITYFLDLLYPAENGDDLPQSLSLSYPQEIVEQPQVKELDKNNNNGDYGGNIEAVSEKLVLIGNSMSEITKQYLKENISQELIEMDTAWSEAGHVDEIIALVPHSQTATACQQTLLVASPLLAIEILKSQEPTYDPHLSMLVPVENGESRTMFYQCLHRQHKKSKHCSEFFKANQVYDSIIKENIQRLQARMLAVHQCQLPVIPLPLLFSPIKTMKHYGTEEDRSIAVNENPINLLLIGQTLFMAQQSIQQFQSYITQELEQLHKALIPLDTTEQHELLGGIHCASNLTLWCTPTTHK